MRSLFLFDIFYPSFTADLIIAFLGAILGLGAAYFVYLSIWQIRRDRLKYVVALIEKIVPSAIRQAEYCKEYANHISQQPFSNEVLKLEANRDPKRLADKVDQEGVYQKKQMHLQCNLRMLPVFQKITVTGEYDTSTLLKRQTIFDRSCGHDPRRRNLNRNSLWVPVKNFIVF